MEKMYYKFFLIQIVLLIRALPEDKGVFLDNAGVFLYIRFCNVKKFKFKYLYIAITCDILYLIFLFLIIKSKSFVNY